MNARCLGCKGVVDARMPVAACRDGRQSWDKSVMIMCIVWHMASRPQRPGSKQWKWGVDCTWGKSKSLKSMTTRVGFIFIYQLTKTQTSTAVVKTLESKYLLKVPYKSGPVDYLPVKEWSHRGGDVLRSSRSHWKNVKWGHWLAESTIKTKWLAMYPS